MKSPDYTEIFECAMATLWLDRDGILHLISKPTPKTIDAYKELFELVKSVMNNKKACALADATKAQPLDKKTREYVATEISNVYKALALTSSSPLGRMIANIYFRLKPPAFPMKMFDKENEAREWLKQYL